MENILREDYFVVDQWQFEELAKVIRKAAVFLYSERIASADRPRMQVTCIDSVESGLAMLLKKHGNDVKIAVIPKGPYILAEVD